MQNPAAFPSAEDQTNGMSLRDYFAAAAMQGILAAHTGSNLFPEPDVLARMAYKAADTMLAERVKE